MRSLVIVALLLTGIEVSAANHYVRQGGSGNGSDWTNACGGFSGSCAIGSLVRGDTYYIGNGTVTSGATTWNRAASGSTPITIKKATVADHGTSTGWSDAYAAQAVFNERNTFSTAYWIFDGVVGDYDTLGIGSYGFKFKYSVGGAGALFNAANVTLRYIDCEGYTGSGDYNYPNQAKCIEAYGGSNWTVSHVAMHGCESCIQGGGTGWLLEYSYIYNARSIATNFHQNVFYCSSASNATFRYNKIWDFNAEGFFVTGYDGAVHDIAIYGNIFSGTGTESNYPRGVELRQDYSYSNILIYNNTMYRIDTGIINRTVETGNNCTGCIARDNVSVSAGNSLTGLTADNNTDDSINRFVNAGSRDFHLTGDLAGVSLAAPYNVDMDGNTRGVGGVWDQGAYQRDTGVALKSPTNLTATVQ